MVQDDIRNDKRIHILFSSVIFRGIADQIDPAYKEMKSHYFACEIPTLNLESLSISAGNDHTEFGLKGSTKG